MNGTLMHDRQLDGLARSAMRAPEAPWALRPNINEPAGREGGGADAAGMGDPAAPARTSVVVAPADPAGGEFRPRTEAGRRALRRRSRRRATRPVGAALAVPARRGTRVSAEPEPMGAIREAVIGRWARLATTITVVTVLVVVGATMVHPAPRITLIPVRVGPGDTLVTLARSAQPDADPGRVVDDIKQANALSGSDLRSGTVLLVPSERR